MQRSHHLRMMLRLMMGTIPSTWKWVDCIFNESAIMNFCKEGLEELLVPPSNMYNIKGTCLCHGVTTLFDTVVKCMKVCDGLK